MLWMLVLFVCAFVLSVLLTPLLRDFALRRGWVDRPDNHRKLHKKPIPRIGGVPIVLAYAGALSLLLLAGSVARGIPAEEYLTVAGRLLLPAFFVFIIGLVDDLMNLPPWGKVALEVLAALLAYMDGIQIHDLMGHPIPGYVGLPLTIAWLIACTNAFNLIDGLDGLSSGVGLIATLTTLAAGLVHGDIGLVTATAPLAGVLAGFLVFNSNPASVFLGDGGSLWIGFMLACGGVIWSQKSVTALSVTAPMMALFVPLLETGLSIARRLVRCQSIFHADRGHIHHQLLKRGLSPRRAVLLLYGFAMIGACFSLLQSTASNTVRMIILAVFCVVVGYAIRYLRYREFAVAAKLLRRTDVRLLMKTQLSLDEYESLLQEAGTEEECWNVVRAIGREFHFTAVELRLAGQRYQEELEAAGSGQWVLNVPLSDVDGVTCRYRLGTSAAGPGIVELANLLHRCLSAKAEMFRAVETSGVRLMNQLSSESASAELSMSANA